MTLDEAIIHCHEKAKELREQAGFDTDNERYRMSESEKADCIECANEHEQLAGWLEELVELRSQRSSEFEWCKGCKEHDEENHCCHRLSNFIQTQAQEIHDMAYEEGKNDRPTGKWEITKSLLSYETIVRCSICGDAFIGYQTEDYRYCPICGAKMEGEEE